MEEQSKMECSEETVEPIVEVNQENNEMEAEITKQFLSGKLSFSEYAAQMDNKVQEEATDDSTSNTTKVAEPKEKRKKIRRTLPPALKGLVGEANLRFARGDHALAEKMCLEVIRQAPAAPEPYLTLAQIYDKTNPAKSLQFDLIAAHLNPNDEEQWVRLGKLSEKDNNPKQADTCYAKAIAANPPNISLHLKRIKFLESIGDTSSVKKAKLRALDYMTAEHIDIMKSFAEELAKIFFQEGKISKAKDALGVVFKKCPDLVTPELTNMMLELLISLKQFKQCLELFVLHCSINIEFEIDMYETKNGIEEKIKVINYEVPESIQIDLHVKFIICLIHLNSCDDIDPLLATLLSDEEHVETNGDLYLDIAEALMEVKRHYDALKLLIPLVKSKNFGLPAVWLRQAECLNACEFYDQAIASYKTVMELQPEHIEVRFPLCDLLLKLNRKREALAILDQDERYEELDPGLLFKKCRLLKDLKLYNKYWSSGLLLLHRHCFTIRNRDEVCKFTSFQKVDRKSGALKLLRTERGEDPFDCVPVSNEGDKLPVDEEFDLLKDIILTCMKRQRFDLLQRFTFTSLSSKRFRKDYKLNIDLMAIFACIYNNDYYHGYNLVRDLVQKNLMSKKCWNLYNIMIQRTDDSRHNRFLMRLLARADLDMHLHILHANNCILAGTYKYALSEYIALYRIREEPMLAFLIGVTLFQMASQRFSAKKSHLVVQGIGFFNIYKKLRGPDGLQEVYYNIGRAFHQIGMLHVAIPYYKKVLTTECALAKARPNIFNLKQEAAFNLHLIYKNSGANDLAIMYLLKYNIV